MKQTDMSVADALAFVERVERELQEREAKVQESRFKLKQALGHLREAVTEGRTETVTKEV